MTHTQFSGTAPATTPPPSAGRAQTTGLLAAVAVAFLFRVIAANAIVPPWQNPDEPTHFALAKRSAHPHGGDAATVMAIEGDVLRSMLRHDWWTYYERPVPKPAPATFSDVPNDLFRGTADQPAYYRLAAIVLNVLGGSSVESQYFALRGLSIALTLLTMTFGWLGTRAWFGDSMAAAAAAIVALHPQFLLSAISVNPDALISCCGALIWWQVTKLGDHRPVHRFGAMALVVVACIVAALSKRNGLPLIGVAVVGGILGSGVNPWRGLVTAAALVAAAGAAAGLVLVGTGADIESIRRLGVFWLSVFSSASVDVSPARVAQFSGAMIDTAWLTAGWLRFPPPEWWSWAARILTVAAVAGAIRVVASRQRQHLAAASFVLLHAGILLVVAFLAGSVPQGRYLFAVAFPAAVLFLLGVQRWTPARSAERWAVPVVVTVLAALDLSGFLFVLLPAYAG